MRINLRLGLDRVLAKMVVQSEQFLKFWSRDTL